MISNIFELVSWLWRDITSVSWIWRIDHLGSISNVFFDKNILSGIKICACFYHAAIIKFIIVVVNYPSDTFDMTKSLSFGYFWSSIRFCVIHKKFLALSFGRMTDVYPSWDGVYVGYEIPPYLIVGVWFHNEWCTANIWLTLSGSSAVNI